MKPITPTTPEYKKSSHLPLVSPEQTGIKASSGGSTSTTATSSSTEMQQQSGGEDQRKLRHALEEASARDATAKAALAKSDAVILELRSSIRQLKRQLEKMTMEKAQEAKKVQSLERELERLQETAEYHIKEEHDHYQKEISQLQSQLALSNSQARDKVVGELQVQLDRVHAQMLTADMVRKELEDTLEAEQYTWELRVQDQERTIHLLQQDCQTLKEDLEQCRAQWKEAEVGWTKDVQDLRQEVEASQRNATSSQAVHQLQEKVSVLEHEREELQSCLDEAMQELEAVDNELRQSPGSVVEPLQHLYRWLQERTEEDAENSFQMPDTASALVEAIQAHIESMPGGSGSDILASPNAALQIAELEAQLSVYRGDLKAREESSAELRASLKEAVALLKPLQDAVAKSEGEKQALSEQLQETMQREDLDQTQQELLARESQVKQLQDEVKALQLQFANLKKSSPPASPERTNRSMQSPNEEAHEKQKYEESAKLTKAREDIKSKRDTEKSLQEMLRNAQGRFQSLHQQNHDVAAENQQLREKLQELEGQLKECFEGEESSVRREVAGEQRETAILQLEQEVKGYAQELQRKEDEVIKLKQELRRAQEVAPVLLKQQVELEELREVAKRTDALEKELSTIKGDWNEKKEAERVLNQSLKEALSLLMPLQMHLETAEREKKDLSKQLKACRKRLAQLEPGDTESRALSLPREVEMRQARNNLEITVRHLEHENHKLQNALEEFSQNQSLSGDENSKISQIKLKERVVELESRYNVTQEKLDGAIVENRSLSETLKQRELRDKEISDEMKAMKEKLRKSEHELENAKYIATSALMKVEELTMANVEKMSLAREIVPANLSLEFGGDEGDIETRRLRARVLSLQRDLETSKELNDSLELSIQERDRMLEALTIHTDSPKYNRDSYQQENSPQRANSPPPYSSNNRNRGQQPTSGNRHNKGVSWDR